MITIPTGDFTGVLSDAIPFASPDAELPQLNCVRLEWDGEMLHALSTDTFRVAWSQWHPTDEPEGDSQDDLFTQWGGADNPWVSTLPLDDAKELVKVFKLGPKEQQVPITVDVRDGQITVKRARETGHSALTAVMQTPLLEFPDVRGHLAKNDVPAAVDGISYGAKFLADFSKVRQRGPLEMQFTGVTKLTLVSIGDRFVGAIMPTRVGDERERRDA